MLALELEENTKTKKIIQNALNVTTISLCSSEIASGLLAIQTYFEECSASTSERQFNTVLEKFSIVSTVEKQ